MELEYRIDRMRLMSLHGLNVPDFVENVHTQYDQNSIAFLKNKFGDSRVRYLSNVSGKDVETDMACSGVASAYTNCVSLERKGYTTWIMSDDIFCEYEGTIWVDKRGVGKMKWLDDAYYKLTFQNVENILNTRHKIIVRRVFKFLLAMKWKAVKIDFGWAEDFCGELSERIVFLDFLSLDNIS